MIHIGTLFTDIYDINEVLKNDSRLNNKSTNLIYELYFKYLKYGIGIFEYDSTSNLNDRIDFSQNINHYIADGVDNVYLLSSTPTNDSNFYVGYRINSDYNYTEIYDTNYVFDNITNTITINVNIPANYEVYISNYIIGSFVDTLKQSEINILAEAMLIPWSQEQLMKNSLLNMMIYGGESKMYSQANHINEVKDIRKNQHWINVQGMISEFSYKSNNNNYKGLGGGLV